MGCNAVQGFYLLYIILCCLSRCVSTYANKADYTEILCTYHLLIFTIQTGARLEIMNKPKVQNVIILLKQIAIDNNLIELIE